MSFLNEILNLTMIALPELLVSQSADLNEGGIIL